MTSHPSPDGISDERDVPPTGHDAYWNARIMCDGPSDNYSAGVWCERLNELVAAYGTLVRGASEDRARLDTLERLLAGPYCISGPTPKNPVWWIFGNTDAEDASGATLRDVIDNHPATPNQDSPNGR